VSYWASPVEARLCRDEEVALLGGGNSAGQGAVFLSSHARQVRMLVRGTSLSKTMSRYLIDRIAASSNIAVLCETELVNLFGTPDQGLQRVRWRNRRTGDEEEHDNSLAPTRSRVGWTAVALISTRRVSSEPALTWDRPSVSCWRWRPALRGSSPSATSAPVR